ncbi:tRNA-guanine transglycosylase [Candidatus Microgenomates bacterium]|nr:MAG: tRNA-guanine transglycosylase [Candidatus Microgenomates bacterium]
MGRTAKTFKYQGRELECPVFFPDATRAVLKTLDSADIELTKTQGVLVNTFHLYQDLGTQVLKKHKGVGKFMSWKGATISDSGGFQVMSVVKSSGNKKAITDEGIALKKNGKKIMFTPEESVKFQFTMGTDMVVVLDDFTEPGANLDKARDTVERTIKWAKRSKEEYERQCDRLKLTDETRPYLLGVVQGDEHMDLRAECTQRLVNIGFDGLGYGGWPMNQKGEFNYEVAQVIQKNSPDNYLLYGLGIGKPHEIANMSLTGWDIFDCVLPTRDARHARLYVYNAYSIDQIDISKPDFYSYYVPNKEKYYKDTEPVSTACDCLLCTRYSRSYLSHLFKIKELTALRLATIHNLRFYSLLMEKLREEKTSAWVSSGRFPSALQSVSLRKDHA